jgi:drug/metabolite transporter (DMT)-like permease
MIAPISRTMGGAEWALLVALSIVWGGSFFFFAIAVKALPVFTIVFLRVALGASALWLIVWVAGLALPREPQVWRAFLTMGLLNNAIPFSLIVWGQKELASGLAAVLNGTTPFFTVLIANALTPDEKISGSRLAGAAIGLGGVAVMIGLAAVATLGQGIWPQLAILGAAVAYALASVFGRRFAGLPPLLTAAGQTSGSTAVLLPLVLILDQPWLLAPPPLSVWLAIAGLAFLCTSLAYVMYFTILKRAGATNLVLVTFLAPVSAILLGVSFLNETLEPRHSLGMTAIGLGLALIDGRLMRLLKTPA